MPDSLRRYLRRDFPSVVIAWTKRGMKRYFASYAWLVFSWFLRKVSRTSEFSPPGENKYNSCLILVGEPDSPGRRVVLGIDLTESITSWVHESVGIEKCEVLSNLDGLKAENSRRVLVVTYDWLTLGNRWSGFFREIRQLAHRARELDLPIWVAPADPFSLEDAFPAAILVTLCGGATILQSNTSKEGKQFGLIFPSGPHIWTLPPTQFKSFCSDIPWSAREPKALLAVSSDPRRISLMDKVSKSLAGAGWRINFSKLDLEWSDYINLVKSSQVVITTCWMYKVHLTGPRRIKARIPVTAVTHRVWEGFAAGACVVTNSNAVFDSLGFMAGTHYVELWDESARIENITLPPEKELMKIAEAGHSLFSKLVIGNKST